jgi:hypothetical protein
MKHVMILLVVFCLIFSFSDAFSQLSRKNQFEIYAGAGIPQSPDFFKDYFKVGLSLNLQYVIFPSPRVGIPLFIGAEGFTFNFDAFNEDISMLVGALDIPIYDTNTGNLIGVATGGTFEGDGSASIFKFGAGVRPYLTGPESSTQLFLFGNLTYNIYKEKQSLDGGTVQWEDFSGVMDEFSITKQDIEEILLGQSEFEDDFNKAGIGVGAGIEIPAGSRINLIFQVMFNVIFSKDEEKGYDKNHSFVGATAGVVF